MKPNLDIVKVLLFFSRLFAVLAAAILVFVGIIAIAKAQDLDVNTAKGKLKSTLQKLNDWENPTLPDSYEKIEIPADTQGSKVSIPETPDYGHSKIPPDPVEIAKRYRQQRDETDTSAASKGDLMVFVSFSMPEASLNRIAAETAKAGGVMVIRGFKDHSLKKTIAATEQIAALHGELLIHPELFDHYGVHEVPTFVLARPEGNIHDSCFGNSHDGSSCSEQMAVKGDVSLHSVLEYFSEQKSSGALKAVAQAKLARLQGAH